MSQTDIASLVLEVDSSQIKKAESDLTKFNQTSAKTESSAKNLGAANAGAVKGFRDQAEAIAVLQGPLGGVASRFTSVGSLIGNIGPQGAAAAIAFTVLATAVEKAVTKFAELEQQQITIASLLRATNSSSAQTTASIEDLVASISHATLATDTQVRQAIATMLTFRSVTGATFTDAIKLSQDLAAIGFGDINSAARALGRALEDPKQGLQALRREGIIFTQAQQLQITNFLEAGRVADAQKVILDRVRSSVGGAGDAQATGLTGATHALNQATDDLLQRWGQQISDGTKLATVIRGVAEAVKLIPDIKNIPLSVPSAAKAIFNSLRPATDAENEAAAQRDLAKAYDELRAKMLAANEEKQRGIDKAAGISALITKETEDLRKSDLQRAIVIEQRKAEVDATSREGQAIADLVKARFQLQQGVQQEQAFISALGTAATYSEKLKVAQDAVAESMRHVGASQTDINRALNAARLDSLIQQENARIQALGNLASVSDIVAQKERVLNQQRAQGVKISKDQIKAISDIERAQTESSRLQTQTQFGAFDPARQAALAQLTLKNLITDGTVKNAQDYANAQTAIAKALEKTRDSAAIAAAPLENLKRLELEAGSLRGNLDTLATDSVNNLGTALTDIATGATTAAQGFKNLELQVIRSLINMMIRMLILQPIAATLQATIGGFMGGGFNLFSLFGGGFSKGTVGGTGGGLGGLYHAGGIVGSEPTSLRFIHQSYFDSAPRFHSGGIAGDEVPIIARKGEGVFTPGQMAALGGGGVSIEVYPVAGSTMDKSVDSEGNIKLIGRMIDDRVGTLEKKIPDKIAQFNRSPRARG